MTFKQGVYEISKVDKLNDDTFAFFIKCEDIADLAVAGQFVHIKVDGFFLRRPISICNIDKKLKEITIVFQIRGEGTEKLAMVKKGDLIDVMGPLGHGFDISDTNKKAILIGGGIGVPPLLETAKHFGSNASVIIGFRNDKSVILNKEFEQNGNKVFVTTDDGTNDFEKGGAFVSKGFVTDVLEKLLNDQEKCDIVYCCGPEIMLKKIADLAKKHGIRCQVSLEQRMACGVGACLGCACKTKDKHGEGQTLHVCKNGPVFEAEEVVFGG